MTYQPNSANAISTTSFNSRDAATLAAAATFQGVGEDVSAYGRAGISISSDNATDGILTIEVSKDNTIWGGPTRTISDSRFAQPHMWNIVEKYFRIKYVNGTTEATNLTIQVQYSVNADILLGHQLDETLLNETEAIVTRSVNVGLQAGTTNTYLNNKVNEVGSLLPSSYGTEVSRGNMSDRSGVRVEARNSSVGTTERVIWEGGAAYNFLTTAATVRIKAGGNAADTAAGLGAREVTVYGLSGTGASISEAIATNGATVSGATTATFLRVDSVKVTSCGTYATGTIGTGSNTGIISVETSGGTLLAAIPANTGRSAVGVCAIPLGSKGYFKRIRFSPEGGKAVTFRLWSRKNLDDSTAPVSPKLLRLEFTLADAQKEVDLDFPFELEGKEEVWVTGKTSSGTSAASVAFEIEVIAD